MISLVSSDDDDSQPRKLITKKRQPLPNKENRVVIDIKTATLDQVKLKQARVMLIDISNGMNQIRPIEVLEDVEPDDPVEENVGTYFVCEDVSRVGKENNDQFLDGLLDEAVNI